MSLQKRLSWLLIAFATFSLAATFGTIYAVRVHVERAMADLQQTQAAVAWVENLRLAAREQRVTLWEAVAGLRGDEDTDGGGEFFEELRHVARFALQRSEDPTAEEILALSADLRTACAACRAAARGGDASQARELLEQRVAGTLLPALDRQLQRIRATLDTSRADLVDTVVLANTRLLVLALVIGTLGVALIVVGTILIRRWILTPVRNLETATRALGAGHLEHRVSLASTDEFGQLGLALNDMAGRLAQAQAELCTSEAKYRSLFNNLRDATLICDAQGRVLECQDGETALLGRLARDCLGQSLLELCPEDPAGGFDWTSVFGRVLTRGERVRVTDVQLPRRADADEAATVDIIAFRVRLGADDAVAVVLRDVTRQRQAEGQLRRAEAMQATVTLARGVAHDFSSLLTSAIGSLSVLNSELGNGRPSELVRRALRACGQAVSLSRTLLTFAGGDHGHPEILDLRETIELILESLDESCLARVDLKLDLEDVAALIDRDQFTEIILNLLKNACEAMPDGGELRIALTTGKLPAAGPADGPATHALLSVCDTGPGISPDVRERLFEPFFSTKLPAVKRSRGLGLSVVYAAVKNAGGVIQVHSQPGAGATFQTWLPLPQRAPAATS